MEKIVCVDVVLDVTTSMLWFRPQVEMILSELFRCIEPYAITYLDFRWAVTTFDGDTTKTTGFQSIRENPYQVLRPTEDLDATDNHLRAGRPVGSPDAYENGEAALCASMVKLFNEVHRLESKGNQATSAIFFFSDAWGFQRETNPRLPPNWTPDFIFSCVTAKAAYGSALFHEVEQRMRVDNPKGNKTWLTKSANLWPLDQRNSDYTVQKQVSIAFRESCLPECDTTVGERKD